MDKQKIEILKKIQEFRDNKLSPDYESLGLIIDDYTLKNCVNNTGGKALSLNDFNRILNES